jgi:hypothetical protein
VHVDMEVYLPGTSRRVLHSIQVVGVLHTYIHVYMYVVYIEYF